jgi:hypothetical protein
MMPQILRADMNLVDRILFSDKAYAKEIEVKAFIITQEQACAAFCDPPIEPVQLDNKELYGKKTYLFLQVRNNGKKHAWGTLACEVPTYHMPIKISIFGLGRSDSYSYNTYLIHLGSLLLTPNETGTPKISIEWDELCTK